MKKTRAKRKTTTRSETISIRLSQRLRYLARVAAQSQHRPISSFIEWSVEQALALEKIGSDGRTIKDYANFLWDVNEPDRFIKLAINFEELLNDEEQVIWKLIKENLFFWFLKTETSEADLRIPESDHPRAYLPRDGLFENGIPDLKKIREYWPMLQDIARGQKPARDLPTPDAARACAQAQSVPAPKVEKRTPRKD